MTLHVNTGKTQLPKTCLHCVICKNYYICFVYTRALESMLLVFFLLLIPRLCIRLGCRAGTDSGAKVWLEPHGTDDKCKPPMRADPVFLQDTLGSSLLFLLKPYFIYCQHRGNAMPCFPAFSMCVPLPFWWQFPHAGWGAGLQLGSTCRIPSSMGYESQQQRNWGTAAILVKLKGAGEGMSLFWISSISWLLPVVVSGPAKALQVKAVLPNPGTGESLRVWRCARLQCRVWCRTGLVVRTQHGTNWVEEVELWFSFGECDVISGIDPEFCLNQLCLWENDIADGECHFSVM